jgi:hypothetical protein
MVKAVGVAQILRSTATATVMATAAAPARDIRKKIRSNHVF